MTEFQFYQVFESLKNNAFRNLSTASQPGLFWPKFYYSWFYLDEKIQYNILCLRQKLGKKIDKKEIEEFNEIRQVCNI